MRYIIIFLITIVISLFIIFYRPYLGVYKDNITIEYDYNEEGYNWSYSTDNTCLKLANATDNKWIFIPDHNGEENIVFEYKNDENIMFTINYKFKIKGNKIYWIEGSGIGLLEYPNPY